MVQISSILFTLSLIGLSAQAAESPQIKNLNLKKSSTPDLPKVTAPAEEKKVKIAEPVVAKLPKPDPKSESRVEAAVDSEIEELNGLIKKYSGSEKMPRLLMRLGEAYSEKSHLVAFRLQESGKSPDPAYALNVKAAEAYKRIAREFPKSSLAPAAIYLMGYNYFEARKPQEGEEAYNKVISEYPTDPAAGAARLQLAEYLFERRQWDKAVELYATVMQDEKNSTNLLIAKYKHSWCLYHKGDIEHSLAEMKGVFQFIKQDKSGASASLLDETTKALIYLFSHDKDYSGAVAFLKSIEGGDKLVDHLALLAAKARENGDADRTAYLYAEALKISPNHAKAPYFEYDSIPKSLNIEKPLDYQDRLAKWLKKFAPDSRWAKANSGAEVTEFRRYSEERAFTWAMYNHRGVQFGSKGASLDLTIQAYDLYFIYFNGSPRADVAHYFCGELMFDKERYVPAAQHYEAVLARSDSKHYEDALMNAVLAHDKSLPSAEEIKNLISSNDKPKPYPDNVKLFINSGERYLAKHPRDGAAASLRYRMAVISYAYKHFDDAESGFRIMVKDFPKTELAGNSANMILDIQERRGDYAAFVQSGKEFLKDPNLVQGKAGAEIRGMVEKATFKIAQDAGGNPEKSTVLFLAFAKEYPKSELTGLAHFNAAVQQEKAGQSSAAVENFERSLQATNKGEYEVKARKALVDLYNKLGQFPQAAEQYDQLTHLVPPAVEKADYHFKAGVLWFSLGKLEPAHQDLKKAMELDPKLSRDSLETMIDVSEEKKDYKSASQYASMLISSASKDPKRCAWLFRRGQLERDGGDQKKFYADLAESNDCFNSLSSSDKKTWAATGANVKFLLAKRELKSFTQPLTPKEEPHRQKILQGKMKALDTLDSKWREVIELNVSEFIVKSLAGQGEAYQYLAKFIEQTPVPKELDGESLADYKSQVGGIVTKMQGQAKTYNDLAAKKAAELKVLALLNAEQKYSERAAKIATKDVFN